MVQKSLISDRWPAGVRPITPDDLKAIGVDSRGQLYLAGQAAETKHRIELNLRHKVVANGVALSAIVLAVIEIIRFGRDLGWWLSPVTWS